MGTIIGESSCQLHATPCGASTAVAQCWPRRSVSRARVPAPPSTPFGVADLEAGWVQIQDNALSPLLGLLENGFDNVARPFTNKQYMEVYRVCYVMCTQRTPHNFSEALYIRHGDKFKTYLRSTVLPALQVKQSIALLEELRRRWLNHNIMNKWMFKFFRYLVSARLRVGAKTALPPLRSLTPPPPTLLRAGQVLRRALQPAEAAGGGQPVHPRERV